MKAVLTGDIINSQEVRPEKWLKQLKACLNHYGEEFKTWEVFRGDSFQLRLSAELGLKAAFHIKACVRQVHALDARISIGLGKEVFNPGRVSEATGSAYVYSGKTFESLKKSKLKVKSGKNSFDTPINIMLQFAQLSINSWSNTVAEVVELSLIHPEKKQIELAAQLNKSQSNISEALKRAAFEEILMVEKFYRNELQKL